jgi:Cu+-exporting ATPase
MKKIDFFIRGLHCASCVYVNEEALKRIPFVKKAFVNLATGKATIEVDGKANLDLVKKAVESVGYQAVFEKEKTLDEKIKQEKEQELKKLKGKLFLSLILAFLILWGSFPILMMTSPWFLQNYFFQFLAASIVQIFGGWDFYRSAISALKHRLANMDTLVAIGTTVSYLYSTIVVFFPNLFINQKKDLMPYFDVSSIIIALILLGRYLEAKAKSQTSEAIKKLIGLQPKEATLIIKN